MLKVMSKRPLGVWFPAIKAGTGSDVFTERLVSGLQAHGVRADITWLPRRAEYAPWTVSIPNPPKWATICHINTWLHPRFIPKHLPVVATLHHSIHDPALHPYKGWLRAAYHRWWIAPIERRVLRRASRVIAVSEFVVSMARQTLCDVPIRVIHNGIDTEKFSPGSRARKPGEPFQLLYVGSWKALKGVDLLATIMRELGEGFELHYTGGKAAKKDRPKLPSNMHDLGRLSGDGVVAALREADALLFPTRSEGFGLVAAEAMACGVPVIATRSSSIMEVVDDGVTGILCAPGDKDEFSDAARRIAQDIVWHRAMARMGRKRCLEMFSNETMVNSYISSYGEMMAEQFFAGAHA